MSLKWIILYIINGLSIFNLMFYRENNKECTKLLKKELKLAKQYPQYVVLTEYYILLHNHIFWIRNKYYMSGIYTKNAKLVTYYVDGKKYYFSGYRLCQDREKSRPSIYMRVQLEKFIQEYLDGKYN